MVEVFKTDVQNKRQCRMLLSVLNAQFSFCKINFDLSDCDRILRVEGENIPVHQVIGYLHSKGFRSEVLD